MKILVKDGKLYAEDFVVIPYIVGDGIGKDITPVAIKVFDAAIEKVYGKKRKVIWKRLILGEEAIEKFGTPLPEETLEEIREHVVVLKGPLTTPISSGYRSVNVSLRQMLDLYTCFRPIKYIKGIPSPLKNSELIDVVIFRENLEDTYTGIEWKIETKEQKKFIEFLNKEFSLNLRNDVGLTLKVISEYNTKRIGRAAIEYAIKNKRKSVTIVHKGNIMKYTEGFFKDTIYKLAKEEFSEKLVFEDEIENYQIFPEDKIIIKDRITDSMFQQMLLRPNEYDVIVTTNLNGDYLSEAIAGEVGGVGIIPSANINFENRIAVFEPIHGSSPKHAGKNEVNPTSIILSGALMFEYIGWIEVKKIIYEAIEKTINSGYVTYDLNRLMPNSKKVLTSEFGEKVIENL
ncbi:MAG: NADP-dependent isocitrate dehydrogenase [Caldisericia bacterium]